LLPLVCACSGNVGTVNLSLTTAPGSHVLDSVQTLQLTITNPHQVTTASRTSAGGFDIVLDLPANGATGALVVEGLDASGATIAVGQSPPFPFGGINAKVVVYMAAPDSVGPAPVMLAPARSELAAGALGYGAIVAGGRDVTGSASDAVAIYNAFDHSLTVGAALPSPRAGMALGVGAGGIVYLFGGNDPSGSPTASTWRFDTTTPPNGSYTDYGDKSGFARADQLAVPIGNDGFLITGTPPAELDGLAASLTAQATVASLPAAGATTVGSDGVIAALFAGSSGVVRYRNGAFDTLSATALSGVTVVALPAGKLAVVCGGTTAQRIDAATGAIEMISNVPAVARSGCAAAATSRHLVIAGGSDASASVEVFDATTLAPIATATLTVPRTGATAIALPNDQVMVVGGTDDSGAPTGIIELFTPSAP
jgi:hypothetical protein